MSNEGSGQEAPDPPEGELPRSVSTGTNTYYLERAADFVRRYPARQPPTYYIDFGDKCLHQFRAAQPEFSALGQRWLETTLRLLQESIEGARSADPAGFDRLEVSGRALQQFAFSTHASAYIDAGVFDLPPDDLWRILRTPDMTNLISPDAIKEVIEVLGNTGRGDVSRIVERTSIQDGLLARIATALTAIRRRVRLPRR